MSPTSYQTAPPRTHIVAYVTRSVKLPCQLVSGGSWLGSSGRNSQGRWRSRLKYPFGPVSCEPGRVVRAGDAPGSRAKTTLPSRRPHRGVARTRWAGITRRRLSFFDCLWSPAAYSVLLCRRRTTISSPNNSASAAQITRITPEVINTSFLDSLSSRYMFSMSGIKSRIK